MVSTHGMWCTYKLYQLCTHSRSVDLDLRLHLGESLQGLLGRCDGFPVQEKRHSHSVALVGVNPAEFHHLISEAWFWPQDHWWFPVKMFKSTFCGAACSSVGGPMMFSLKKILVTYICQMPSPFIFPEIPPNCGRDVTARPAPKVVHHHCSGFLRVPVKNNHFHWILRTAYDQKVAPLTLALSVRGSIWTV